MEAVSGHEEQASTPDPHWTELSVVELEFHTPNKLMRKANYQKLPGRLDRVIGERWEERSISILDKEVNSVKAEIQPEQRKQHNFEKIHRGKARPAWLHQNMSGFFLTRKKLTFRKMLERLEITKLTIS